MKVVSTSEREWMASEIMAPERPHTPASRLKAESRALPIRLTRERRRMTAFSSRERGAARFDIKETSCGGRLYGPVVFSYAHSFFEIRFRREIEKGTRGTYNCPTDAVVHICCRCRGPTPPCKGIACSVCTVDLASVFGKDVMQCKEFLVSYHILWALARGNSACLEKAPSL